MKSSLREVATDLCSISDRDGLEALPRLLKNIQLLLNKISSRFVDIDPSARINEEEVENFKHLIHIFPEDAQEHLVEIYEAFSLYLLMHDRFGEAADWYLKNEYDAHLSEKIAKAIEALD